MQTSLTNEQKTWIDATLEKTIESIYAASVAG